MEYLPLAAAKVGRAHLCRAAGKTLWSQTTIRHPVALRWSVIKSSALLNLTYYRQCPAVTIYQTIFMLTAFELQTGSDYWIMCLSQT